MEYDQFPTHRTQGDEEVIITEPPPVRNPSMVEQSPSATAKIMSSTHSSMRTKSMGKMSSPY